MIADRPLLGVGVGQYLRSATLFLSPQLAWSYGSENAHNNFFQIGGELGLIGLTLFIALAAAPLMAAGKALSIDAYDVRLLGAAAGCAAFVLTWIGSHPLLVPEVAYPFWIQLGLVWALARSTLLNATGRVVDIAPRRHTMAAITASIVLVIATAISAQQRPLEPPATPDVDGFYPWETAEDGVRFRWTKQFASIFVPADVTRVYIPVRLAADPRSVPPIDVDVMVGGAHQTRMLVGNSWADLNVPLPDAEPPTRIKRIDLRMSRTWQPALYIPGSADMRAVGVQVGEPKLFRER
jgi:hypothetical protein